MEAVSLSVMGGLSVLFFSQLALFGRRDKCQEMYDPGAWLGLLLSHSGSQCVHSVSLSHSPKQKPTAPSLTAIETNLDD